MKGLSRSEIRQLFNDIAMMERAMCKSERRGELQSWQGEEQWLSIQRLVADYRFKRGRKGY